MTEAETRAVLCLASYEKGQEFIRECKREGCYVILLTVSGLENGDWPTESIDELYNMPDLTKVEDVIRGVGYLARTHNIERIIALDDYDVWTAAALREHMRLPGIGDSTIRYFRDKLAMRVKARKHSIPVPEFVPVFNYEKIRAFLDQVPGPWLLKPRAEASTIGITKINTPEELWERLSALGDKQSFYVLERYLPGEVYHVDSLVSDGEVIFAEAHQYARPPLDVYHEGGVSSTRTVERGSEDEQILKDLNRRVLGAFGMQRGATHMEFIKGRENGAFYFLETAARVGGANIVDLIEAATNINLWREWAKIELAMSEYPYRLPETRQDYGGVIVTLARQEYPDTSAYQDPEIVWRMNKRHHVGFVIASPDYGRVQSLLDEYMRRFAEDFSATLPPLENRPPAQHE